MSKDNSQPEVKAPVTEAVQEKTVQKETPRKGFDEKFVGYDAKGTKKYDY